MVATVLMIRRGDDELELWMKTRQTRQMVHGDLEMAPYQEQQRVTRNHASVGLPTIP